MISAAMISTAMISTAMIIAVTTAAGRKGRIVGLRPTSLD